MIMLGALAGLMVLATTSYVLWRNSIPQGATNPNPTLVSSERDFILGMVPHHQEAVDSSKALLNVATDADIRSLATSIVSSQEKEISQMKAWYKDWFNEPFADNGKYKPMMRSIQGLSPKDSEARFVADMIGHHEHAVLMARELAAFATKPELVSISGNIIRDQEAEIAQLKVWLQQKYGQAPPMVDHSMHKM